MPHPTKRKKPGSASKKRKRGTEALIRKEGRGKSKSRIRVGTKARRSTPEFHYREETLNNNAEEEGYHSRRGKKKPCIYDGRDYGCQRTLRH